MILKYFISILFILPAVAGAGQELLANGGFEDENICTEYNVNCAPEAWISNTSGFNNYFKDASRSYEGLHCMAIEAGNTNRPFQRTFIRSQLLCGLKKGNKYRLEFFIKSAHPILDSVGVYFGPIDPLLERKPIDKLAPSLFLIDNPGNIFSKDSSWQKAVLDYTANGEEVFITIANFSRRDITGSTGISKENHFFVFIDNISLVPLNPAEKLCADWQQTKEDIYAQNERHQLLQRWIQYRTSQPTRIILTPNTVTVTDTLLLPDVLFASGKSVLQKSSYSVLDRFMQSFAGRQVDSIVVEGHTDSTGLQSLNAELSVDRAKVIGNYFSGQLKVDPQKLVVRGWASQRPVDTNRTSEGRQKNRRVEVFVYTRE